MTDPVALRQHVLLSGCRRGRRERDRWNELERITGFHLRQPQNGRSCGRSPPACGHRKTYDPADRPEMKKALSVLEPGDVLVVWRLDRLGRSLAHLIDVMSELERCGIGFLLDHGSHRYHHSGRQAGFPHHGCAGRVRARADQPAGQGRYRSGKGTWQAPRPPTQPDTGTGRACTGGSRGGAFHDHGFGGHLRRDAAHPVPRDAPGLKALIPSDMA